MRRLVPARAHRQLLPVSLEISFETAAHAQALTAVNDPQCGVPRASTTHCTLPSKLTAREPASRVSNVAS